MTDPQDSTPGQPGLSADAAPEALAPAEPGAFPEPAPLSAGEAPPTLATGVAPVAKAPSWAPNESRPTFRFFGIVAAVSLVLDVSSKAWAEIRLYPRGAGQESIELIKDHLGFTLAYNPGGAWGLFQHHSEYIRRPFFLLVSLLAIAFIINLYGRLTPQQHALKWGLPLVLGGALGNLSDRIVRSNVIDFIDYQAKWIESMNRLVAKVVKGWTITDHWPTFNVADIAICVGVGLMAVDMFTSRRGASPSLPPRAPMAPLPVVPVASVSAPEPLKPDA
ncbi:MAG: Lipoprotein signal peptidase [Polyangiaceae bacterium]|jgi:signal peptidase II|nr:Lipoprotein signal peptidase [Polyangiaceae bacterium]